MARYAPGKAPLTYRAYRFPHRRGRLTRRWQPRAGLVGFAAVLAAMFGAFAVFGAILGSTAVAYVVGDLPSVKELKTAPLALSTFIYDRSGTELLYTLEEERRELVALDEVPAVMQNATIAIEDKSFWSNPGVDVAAIVRAAIENLNRGEVTQGASTITQQLVRARLLDNERTVERKIREALLAVEATRLYSKREILEMYFNQIYYGNQSYGIKAAAKTYFGITDLKRLTLGQAALLAGLPQAPSLYDPVRNPDAAKERRAQVLQQMLEQGFITPEQAAAADRELIKVTPARTPIFHPPFVFRVREQLAEVVGGHRVATGGFRVITTLDTKLQEIAERDVRERVKALKANNVHNAAMIVMDPGNAHVLAYVGSVDYEDQSPKVRGDFDVAGIGLRQMGSSFKLFTYLAAFQRGYTPASVIWDVQTAFGLTYFGGPQYRPQNAANGLCGAKGCESGPITMRQALRESLNIPVVKLGQLLGNDAVIAMVHQLGVDRDWDRGNIGASFPLAGDMQLRDLASAYQVVANMGRRVEPTMILKIVDRDDKVVRDWSKPESREVLKPQIAWLLTDILKDTTDPNGSWLFGNWTHIGRPAALKTGTQDDIRDVLAVGWVPQLLTAVWMGNADNTEMFGITSAMGPGVLWQTFMKHAIEHYKLPVEWYERPKGIVERTVCARPGLFGGIGSGLLPGPGCPSGWRVVEKFVEGTEPRQDDRFFWGAGGCALLRAERPEWQADVMRWAASGRGGVRPGGSVAVCGVKPSPSPSASPSAGASPSPSGSPTSPAPRTIAPIGTPVLQPTPAPKPTKKP